MREGEGFCPCPLNEAMDILGSRWTLSIVVTIGNFGRLRFHEIEERLQGIGTKTLARRLKALEKMGILMRESYPEVPPRVEYSLTDEGKRLRDASIPLMTWAAGQQP
ncbi:MAG: winged helix-turn-helix transcriptional regulator [Thermoplasmata archaeon]